MASAYEAWWDDVFPVMVERGGDRDLVWSSHLIKQMDEGKNSKTSAAAH